MPNLDTRLSRGQVVRITNQWIGVGHGYLGDFTYRTHADFYLEYCDLEDVDPRAFDGTTRERFIEILLSRTPHDQAKILRGVLRKYPIGDEYAPKTRDERFEAEIAKWIHLLEGDAIGQQKMKSNHDLLVRTLTDAKILLQQSDARSAVDRVHTAFHSYLKSVLTDAEIHHTPNETIVGLLKRLTSSHGAFSDLGNRSHEVQTVLRSMSAIADALNPLRNHASLAHANDSLLGEDEAMLVVNTVRTILIYLDSKLSRHLDVNGLD